MSNYYLYKNITFISSILLLVSCAAPQKPRKLYADVAIKKVSNSKPRVLKINHSKNESIRYKPKSSHYSPRIQQLVKIYGKQADKRIKDWQYTIMDYRRGSEMQKLHVANSFINRLNFIDDKVHWQQKDYWATPLETLASSGGDCEDLAIAKYYMLTKLGLADQCLTLNYVKVKNYHKPHMVLIYQCSELSEPIVLDNLNPLLLSVKQRQDLTPVYSFNQSGMWLTNSLGKKHKLNHISRLRRWDEVRQRIQQEY